MWVTDSMGILMQLARYQLSMQTLLYIFVMKTYFVAFDLSYTIYLGLLSEYMYVHSVITYRSRAYR